MGVPFNSAANDLYFVINLDDTTGYIASNRDGSRSLTKESCCNDIYQYSYLKKPPPPVVDTPKIDTPDIVQVPVDTPDIVQVPVDTPDIVQVPVDTPDIVELIIDTTLIVQQLDELLILSKRETVKQHHKNAQQRNSEQFTDMFIFP